MKKVPEGEIPTIKNPLNPDTNKPKDRTCFRKNLRNIKELEEKNKKIKEDKKTSQKSEPYKPQKFKIIPSEIKTMTKINEHNKNNLFTNTPMRNQTKILKQIQKRCSSKPSTCTNSKRPIISLPKNTPKKNNYEFIYDIQNSKNESMFDKYYSKKLRSKTPSHINNNLEIDNYNNNYNNEYTYNTDNKDLNFLDNPNFNVNDANDFEIEQLINEYKAKYGTDDTNDTNEPTINKYSPKKQEINLGSIPEVDEKLESTLKPSKKNTLILPKIQLNFNKESRQNTIENKIQDKNKVIEGETINRKHKNYGKIPNYIKKYEIEREIKKEEIKRQDETGKYPKGTKLLNEEERLKTLKKLLINKKNIEIQIEKIPISNKNMIIQNKKNELNKKLEEIEKAIEMFSKKQVFIKG